MNAFLVSITIRSAKKLQRAARIVKLALCSLVALAPLFAFQYVGYRQFCVDTQQPQPYCANLLPNVYSHVQARYWNVGLFAYYELKQVPNFLLAAPTLAMSAAGVVAFARRDLARFLSLGLYSSSPAAAGLFVRNSVLDALIALGPIFARYLAVLCVLHVAHLPVAISFRLSIRSICPLHCADPPSSGFLGNARALPFVYHWALLLAIALTVLHVQVATRFMSACAPLYWFAAAVSFRRTPPSASASASAVGPKASSALSTAADKSAAAAEVIITPVGRAVVIVSLAYAVIGTCLFCTFMPWT
jgi:phosphatidylinositol glycan class V